MDDVYDFTEVRTGNYFGAYANNFGYQMQRAGIISKYSWNVEFDMEFR